MDASARDYRCPVCGRINLRGYLAPGSFIKMRCWHRECRAWMLIKPGQKPVIDIDTDTSIAQKIDSALTVAV